MAENDWQDFIELKMIKKKLRGEKLLRGKILGQWIVR